MNYTTLTIGETEYKLRLNTRLIVELEKRIGVNPVMIFGNGDRIPTITEMVNILHQSLQVYEHGITLDRAYSLFDTYLETHSTTDFISVIVEIYKVSGLIREESENEKN